MLTTFSVDVLAGCLLFVLISTFDIRPLAELSFIKL